MKSFMSGCNERILYRDLVNWPDKLRVVFEFPTKARGISNF